MADYPKKANSLMKWPIQEESATLKMPLLAVRAVKTFSVESYTKTKLHFIHVPLTIAK